MATNRRPVRHRFCVSRIDSGRFVSRLVNQQEYVVVGESTQSRYLHVPLSFVSDSRDHSSLQHCILVTVFRLTLPTPGKVRIYSYRSDSTGSTFVARRAGT